MTVDDQIWNFFSLGSLIVIASFSLIYFGNPESAWARLIKAALSAPDVVQKAPDTIGSDYQSAQVVRERQATAFIRGQLAPSFQGTIATSHSPPNTTRTADTTAMADVQPQQRPSSSSSSSSSSTVTSTSPSMPPPPPPRLVIPSTPSTQQRSIPKPAARTSSLRVPSNGPLPNRSPAAPSSTLLSASTRPLNAQPRKKVILAPGHSPLDWANKQKSGENLAGVRTIQRVTPSQLAAHNGRKGRPAWSVWQGKVYNITPYLPFHPGGEGELMRAAGKGGDKVVKLFNEAHPWVNWENILGGCLVGFLVAEEDEMSGLDAVD